MQTYEQFKLLCLAFKRDAAAARPGTRDAVEQGDQGGAEGDGSNAGLGKLADGSVVSEK